jgi:hypothetical protein
VANVGDTNAKIVAVGVDIFVSGNPFDARPRPLQIVVPPGREARIEVSGGQMLTLNETNQIRYGSRGLQILGMITYEDGNSVSRNTSVYRVFDSTVSLFRRAPENDQYAERDYED